jgi:tetratricopeptide (TPR) repeat protein
MPYFLGFVLILIVGSAAFLAYNAHVKGKPRAPSPRQLDLMIAKLTGEIRRNPGNAAAFCKRGITRQKKGDLPGALADLDQALALDPNLAEAHYHRGAALEQIGDLPGAQKEFDSIAASDDNPFYGTAAKERLAQLRARKKTG